MRQETSALFWGGGGEAAIRGKIRRLHRLLLNEDLPGGDPQGWAQPPRRSAFLAWLCLCPSPFFPTSDRAARW